MSTISKIILKSITSVSKEDLLGVEKIRDYAFYRQSSLASIDFPDTLKEIGTYAFENCTALKTIKIPNSLKEIGKYAFDLCTGITSINTDDMDPYTFLCNATSTNCFGATAWYKNQPSGSAVYIANGKILLGVTNKLYDLTNFTIPSNVVNLAGNCFRLEGDNKVALTTATIPDHVEIVGNTLYSGHSITKLTIGSSVRRLGAVLTCDTTTTTLIFRQPAGMYVQLPVPGVDTGLAYNKSSRSVSIYTDNEYIRNYDWATDNVTPTFYSLSEAPA